MLNKQDLVTYYETRHHHHLQRASDETLKPSERKASADKANRYRREMFRWMFMKEDDFAALSHLIKESTVMWNIKVYESEDSDELISEYDDIPDFALIDLLRSIRQKMADQHYDAELDEYYQPGNEIALTVKFEED